MSTKKQYAVDLAGGLSKKANHRWSHFLWERLSSRDSAVD